MPYIFVFEALCDQCIGVYFTISNKLNGLTEFDHGLIYGFDPAAEQFEDMLNGYLFAQNSSRPAFKKEWIYGR